MQVCCPVCETQIDYETLVISNHSIVCPTCASQVDLGTLVSGHSSETENTGTFDSSPLPTGTSVINESVTGESGPGESVSGEPLSGASISRFDDNPTKSLTFTVRILEPGTKIGKFEIEEQIGRGGFGNVYRAKDTKLNRVVALKIPRAEASTKVDTEAFLREAQMAASVRDPNIVSVHEIGQDGETSYICSDFIEGSTLKSWVRAKKPTIEDICRMMIRIARSLHKAHETGLVHRDLKPANILVDNEDIPYITDFGLAQRNLSERDGSRSKREIVGTPAYMSPEQAMGKTEDVNHRSDLFSMGIMLYELTTGQRPFQGDPASIIQDVIYQQPIRPAIANSTVAKALEAIILRAMEKDPYDRFASAADFADDLQRYLDGEPTESLPLSKSQWIGYQAKQNRVAILVCSLILIAAGTTYGLVNYFHQPEVVVEKLFETPMVAVRINSIPERANVAIVPIDPNLNQPILDQIIQPESYTPVDINLPAGDYIIEFYVPGLGPHEVRRSISERQIEEGELVVFDAISLPKVDLSTLALVKGGEVRYAIDPDQVAWRDQTVADFYMQTHEVTVADYQKVTGTLPGYVRVNVDLAKPDYPITHLTVEEAELYAEKKGMRLPEFAEFYFATSNGGTTNLPWGDKIDERDYWQLAPVKFYQIDETPPGFASAPIYGLFSNVPEMTATTIIHPRIQEVAHNTGNFELLKEMAQAVAVTGTPGLKEIIKKPIDCNYFEVVSRGGMARQNTPIGFRCVKSVKPRFIILPAQTESPESHSNDN